MNEEIDEVIIDDEDDSVTQWCPICEMQTTFSENTPYGTCMCS
jgi:hypothetical protein